MKDDNYSHKYVSIIIIRYFNRLLLFVSAHCPTLLLFNLLGETAYSLLELCVGSPE